MSTALVKCPNCGSTANRTTKQDEYKCAHCGAQFHFIRTDVQKIDTVAHNCPVCGKSVESARGNRCLKCGRYDLCDDCVGEAMVDKERKQWGLMCKVCIKEEEQDCRVCGKWANVSCPSCYLLHERGLENNPSRACSNHGLVTAWVGGITKHLGDDWYTILYCKKCAEETFRKKFPGDSLKYLTAISYPICDDCAVKKRGLLSIKLVCRNCGSDLTIEQGWYPEARNSS